MTPAPPERDFDYAGFWVRAAARVIDLLVILAVFKVFTLLDRFGSEAGLWAGGGFEESFAADRFSADQVMRGVFYLGFPVFYSVYLHGSCGQTFGKMALRIRVLNEDGSPIGFRKAMARWFGYLLCDLTLYFGYFWAAFDARKQGLHDRICRTIVVRDPHGTAAEGGAGSAGGTGDGDGEAASGA